MTLVKTLSRFPSWCCWARECRSRVFTVVSGVAPSSRLPRLSASSWSNQRPADSSALDQTDSTRICTLKLNNDHSSLRFPHLGVDYMIHHLLSHSDTADWLKVNQFFLEQVAYIARRLDAIKEGDRTLLDNTMMLYCSSMLNGGHDATQLPVVLVGGGGGRIQGGRVLDYREKSERQMCRLFLSMMDKMDYHPKQFGDASQAMSEI